MAAVTPLDRDRSADDERSVGLELDGQWRLPTEVLGLGKLIVDVRPRVLELGRDVTVVTERLVGRRAASTQRSPRVLQSFAGG